MKYPPCEPKIWDFAVFHDCDLRAKLNYYHSPHTSQLSHFPVCLFVHFFHTNMETFLWRCRKSYHVTFSFSRHSQSGSQSIFWKSCHVIKGKVEQLTKANKPPHALLCSSLKRNVTTLAAGTALHSRGVRSSHCAAPAPWGNRRGVLLWVPSLCLRVWGSSGSEVWLVCPSLWSVAAAAPQFVANESERPPRPRRLLHVRFCSPCFVWLCHSRSALQ